MSDVLDPWDALWDLIDDRLPESDLIKLGDAGDFVDAIRKAAWRPPAQVIDSIEGLTALKPLTVVRWTAAFFQHIHDGWWWTPGSADACSSEQILDMADGEAVEVVWSPTEKAGTE